MVGHPQIIFVLPRNRGICLRGTRDTLRKTPAAAEAEPGRAPSLQSLRKSAHMIRRVYSILLQLKYVTAAVPTMLNRRRIASTASLVRGSVRLPGIAGPLRL